MTITLEPLNRIRWNHHHSNQLTETVLTRYRSFISNHRIARLNPITKLIRKLQSDWLIITARNIIHITYIKFMWFEASIFYIIFSLYILFSLFLLFILYIKHILFILLIVVVKYLVYVKDIGHYIYYIAKKYKSGKCGP